MVFKHFVYQFNQNSQIGTDSSLAKLILIVRHFIRALMSLTHAVPSASQECTNEQLNDEEKNILLSYFRVLVDHLNCSGVSIAVSPLDGSDGKLSKLVPRHLMELASDMCDELDRRDMGSSAPLPAKPELSTKRNNARIRMADFNGEKLNNLILDVVQEIDRRKITPTVQKSLEEDTRKRGSSISTESTNNYHNSPINSKKVKSAVSELRTADPVSSAQAKNISLAGGMCSGFNSLNAIIEDLGSLIDNDSDENFSELKQKYEAEISNLKQTISKYETSIIPEKNREISKLMARIEETELINSHLRKELSSMNDKLSCQETIINDQKLVYHTIKEAIENIQNQISCRVNKANEDSHNAARFELLSNNVFFDINAHNGTILSAIREIENCASNFNPKLFLKVLRDIATSAKSFVLLMDKILQVAHSLSFKDLCEEGEKLKSDYIVALSSLLVSGKDFSARPEYCSDFKLNLENLKCANGSLFDFKNRFEIFLQNN